MADTKTSKTPNPTGGDPSAQKADLTNPAEAVTQAGDPERFLREKPANVVAQEEAGMDPPPTPNAEDDDEPPQGTKRFKLPAHTGWFDGSTHHPAGATVDITQQQHKALVKAGVLSKTDEPVEPRRMTTEAKGQRTR